MAESRKTRKSADVADETTPPRDVLHRRWPLGGDEHAITTTEFEWSIIRFFSAFERSSQQLAATAGADDLAFQELILLHVVAMQHHPQTAASLARQLNRDDVPNLQYALRKLQNANLVEKRKEPRGKTYSYAITEPGAAVVQRYAQIRKLLLIAKTKLIDDIDARMSSANDLLGILTGVYDDVSRIAATYSPVDE